MALIQLIGYALVIIFIIIVIKYNVKKWCSSIIYYKNSTRKNKK